MDVTDSSITMEMTDQKGQKVKRTIEIENSGLSITDTAEGYSLLSFVHIEEGFTLSTYEGYVSLYVDPYAVDYGEKNTVTTYEVNGTSKVRYSIGLGACLLTEYERAESDQYEGYKPLAFINNKLSQKT